MTSLILTLSLALAVPSQTIDFDESAQRLVVLLPKLSKQIGVTLEVDKPLANEVVTVSVHGVSSSDLMARIGKVSSGTWTKTKEGYKLELLADTDRKQRQQDAEQIAKNIEQLSATSRRALGLDGSVPTFNADEQTRQCMEIVNLIPAKDFVSFEPNSLGIMAYPPTRGEKPLPQGVWRIAQSAVQKHRDANRLSKVSLVVQRHRDYVWLLTVYCLFDTGNFMHLRGSFNYGSPDQIRFTPDLQANDQEIILENSKLPIVAYLSAMFDLQSGWSPSAYTRTLGGFVDATPFVFDKRKSIDMDDADMLRQLVSPVENEPLKYPGIALRQLSQRLKLNMIACLPDQSLGPACKDIVKGKSTTSVLADRMSNEWCLTLTEQNGWLEAKPRRPAHCRDNRIDRQALQDLAIQCSSGYPISLEMFAKYCAIQPDGDSKYHFDTMWIYRLAPEMAKRLLAFSFKGDRKMYRFYGMLNQAQISAIKRGASFPYTTLSLAQRKQLTRCYSTLTSNVINKPITLKEGEELEDIGIDPFFRTDSLYWEHLPTDLKPDGVFTGRYAKHEMWFGLNESNERVGVNHLVDCRTLPLSTNGTGPTAAIDVTPVRTRFPAYQLGTRETVKLELKLPPPSNRIESASYWYVFTNDWCDKASPPSTFNSLPQAVRKWIEEYDAHVLGFFDRINGPRKNIGP